MKNLILILLLLPIMVTASVGQTPKKKLIWSEEFNYLGLPDSKKWTYEEGKLRNNEAQYYTKKRSENVRVEGGNLIITARKESFRGAEYTSGSINTKGLFEFTGGRIEVCAKIPAGVGVWPAIWTLGTNIGEVGWPAW